MGSLPQPERLTDEEMGFVRSGDSPEIETWNRNFVLLVDEYRIALAEQDEGWASERIAEVRKCLGGLQCADQNLMESVGNVIQHRRYHKKRG